MFYAKVKVKVVIAKIYKNKINNRRDSYPALT